MLRRVAKNERGSVILIIALGLSVLAGMAGMVVDVGYLYLEHAKLQNGVDAACLAGAAFLPDTGTAASKASFYATANGLTNGDLISSFPNTNRIDVTYTEEFGTFFLRLLGVDSATIKVKAAAILPGAPNSPAVLALKQHTNTVTLRVNGNDININGSMHSNSLLGLNGSITVDGGVSSSDSPLKLGTNVNVTGSQTEGASIIETPDYGDKIDALPSASYDTNQRFNGNNTSINGTIKVNGSIDINGNNISGDGSLIATGDIHNNGNAITQSGSGEVFIYSSDGNIHINGNNITIDATLFAPNGDVTINGNNITINGRIIGNTVTVNGSGLTVNGPSGPGAGLSSIPQLVE